MLGAIGFLCAALAVGAFAYTADRSYGAFLRERERWLFSFAFALLAACMVAWATASMAASQNNGALSAFMFVSDILLVAATIAMACVALPRATEHPLMVALLVALGAMAVVARIALVPVTASGNDEGMLVFGLEGVMRNVVAGGFLFVWLPTVFMVAKSMRQNVAIAPIANPFVVLFSVLVILSLGLVVAFRPLLIAGLFIAITALFLVGAYVNITLLKITAHSGRKK